MNSAPAGRPSTITAETANVAALIRNAVAGEPSRSSSAPHAGPAMIDADWIIDRAAVAAGRSASSTSRGTVAAAAGGYTADTAVEIPASTGANSTGRPATTTSASSAITPTRSTSEAIIKRRRSYRSARMPPNGPSSTIGSTRAAVVTAVQGAEWVRS